MNYKFSILNPEFTYAAPFQTACGAGGHHGA